MRLSHIALTFAALIPPVGRPATTGSHASTPRASLGSPEPGLILAVDQDERRVRRPPGLVPFTIKVDPLNGGSPDLVMGYEVLPPGQFIPPHRHPRADEILFIQYRRGVAELGGRRATVGPGEEPSTFPEGPASAPGNGP